jgi:hypothetical protein
VTVTGAAFTQRGGAVTLRLTAGRFNVTVSPTRGCVRRARSSFRIHQPRRGSVVRVDVYVHGRLVKTVRGRRVRRVAIAGLPHRRVRVRIVATSRGQRTTSVRTYGACRKGRPRTRVVRGGR